MDVPAGSENKKRKLHKTDSEEPVPVMVEASRRVVSAKDINSGALLHVLALENLQGFKRLQPQNPLCLGQRVTSLQEPLSLTWATACSGSEGMYYVAEAMGAAYEHLGTPVNFVHEFSCESSLADIVAFFLIFNQRHELSSKKA